jgi:hypothetical protein
MFETVTEVKKREGIGGFISRHFGAVVDAELARDGTRDIALVLVGLSVLCTALLWSLLGPKALSLAIILGAPAAVLRFMPSRIAASVLLGLTALIFFLPLPSKATLFCLWGLFALRGVQLTIGYHRLHQVEARSANVLQSTSGSEAYAPLGLDNSVARQSSRVGWKVYAFLLSGFFFAGYIYLFLADFQAFVVPDCLMSGFGLVGLFGYAFRRRLLHARVWVFCAIILPVWDLISNFVYEVSPAGTVFAIAVLLPKYVALWRYGHSSEIWVAEATEPTNRETA